jgi:Ran GTPase-activating protein (RanGAP) involved in mRNA processing and transport
MESARCLSRSLRSHACIGQLTITHCELGSSPEILSVILQSNVKSINLDNNNIDSLGAVKIAEYLEGDPPIHRIDIDHNRLNDDDAILISHALKRNTNLHRIYLRFNNLTTIGVKALLTCVFDSSSLNAISESNHTLTEIDIISRHVDNLAGSIDRLLSMDRTQKILLALQDKDSLLQYLANLPVELIPEVLAFSQREGNSCQHKQLNIVYSTMRWWNMPMLYSYHNYAKSDTKRKRDE